MKNQELMVLGLAGVAVFLIVKSTKKTAPMDTGKPNKPADWVSEIFDGAGKQFDNAWRYFDNGVAIDPSGNYYQNGQMVYQAIGAGA